ncbi:MAG: hypothetical protein H9W81_13595 [Enterococcus sp.]|nr:hypothetical protein [Enterococcus sp.]
MSTKLYDGILISTEDIFEFTAKLHQRAYEVFTEQAKKLAMEEITTIFDKGGDDTDRPLYFVAEEKWRAEQAKMSRTHTFEDPLRFSLVMGKASTGKILGYPYYSQPEYFTALLDMDEVTPYGYWNNTDAEEGVTEEEWKNRCREWDSVLDPITDTFGALPLYQLPDSRNPFKLFTLEIFAGRKEGELLNSMLEAQPSAETRLKRAFQNAVVDGFVIDKETINRDFFTAMRESLNIPVKDMGELPAPITFDDLYGEKTKAVVINKDGVTQALKNSNLTPKP